MDMRLVKESIHLEQPTAPHHGQTVVEGEIALPGGLREEARVLHAGAMAVIDHVEAMQDRVSVMGKVVFHALYSQGDHTKVNALEATADFTHLMDMPGAQPRNTCWVEAQVEHVDASAASGRLNLRGVVRLVGQGVAVQPVEVVTGVQGVDGLQSRSKEVTVKRTVATGKGETLLREEFALPEGLQVRETLYATAYPKVMEITGGLGRAGLSGQVQLEVVHAADLLGKPVVITRHSIPFEHAVELNGESGELLKGGAVVRDVAVASQDVGNGERTLRAEVLLGLNAMADRKETMTLLDDAYTTSGDDLRLTAAEVRFRTEDSDVYTAESGKLMLLLPEGSPAVRSVLCAFASPVVTGREQIGGRLTVEGVMQISLLYMSDDAAEPKAVFREEPFRLTFAAQAGEKDQLTLCCTDTETTVITSDRVEVRYIAHLHISGTQCEQTRLVTDVLPVSTQAPTGSIVLYFVQPGEDMWDIARRYRVPEKELRDLNPEVSGEVHTGQGIVVWHR